MGIAGVSEVISLERRERERQEEKVRGGTRGAWRRERAKGSTRSDCCRVYYSNEEYEPGVGNTGKRIVPRKEGGQYAPDATGLLQAIGGFGGAIVVGVLGACEEQEGQVEGEEEEEEHDGGPQGAQEQDEGEDEPARQEEAQHGGDLGRVCVGVDHAERWGENQGVGDPETAVRGQGSGTKGVAYGHFPIRRESVSSVSITRIINSFRVYSSYTRLYVRVLVSRRT